MTIPSHSVSASGATSQANDDGTVEQMNHGRLAKLDLSDGKSLYAKLVVIIYSIFLEFISRSCPLRQIFCSRNDGQM